MDEEIKTKNEAVMSEIEDWLNDTTNPELDEIKDKINTMNDMFGELNKSTEPTVVPSDPAPDTGSDGPKVEEVD